MESIKRKLDELVDHVCSDHFNGCNAAMRGYHLVCQIEDQIRKGLFWPHQVTVEYDNKDFDESTITVNGYPPIRFVYRLRTSTHAESIDLHDAPI